jgi:hypothetical protein
MNEEVTLGKLVWVHVHDFVLPCGDSGPCVKRCHEDTDGTLWCSDDYKATRVNFCPACGYEAKNKVGYE